MPKPSVRVACVQFGPAFKDVQANIARADHIVRK